MTKLENIIKGAEQHCRRKGTRLTLKRQLILRCLLLRKKPTSAYGIKTYLKENYGEEMPATSIYRILSFLQENLLVHKLQAHNKFIACAHIVCKHDHGTPQFLICQKCETVKEIDSNSALIEELQRDIRRSKFQLISPQLEMLCICNDCQTETATKSI
ncbi:MAG: transcriptional repressor [Proteobacteria bacterium]|nr:transcriptional repressor [Pseudomonadota bacterium]|tara:strand:- start:308 stop:781 length:474 start_codon:yes stop_codon:yes gene_type:complete